MSFSFARFHAMLFIFHYFSGNRRQYLPFVRTLAQVQFDQNHLWHHQSHSNVVKCNGDKQKMPERKNIN